MVASRPLRSLAVLVVCAVAAVAAAPFASADELPAGTPSDRLDVHLWRPGQAVDDYLAAESGSVMSAGRWSAGLFVDYESRPLVAVASSNGMRGDEVTVVDSSVLFDLTFAYGVYDRLQLGVDVAVVSEQAGTLDVGAGVGNQTRLGDLRADAKLRILGPADAHPGLAIAAAVGLTAPVGDDSGFSSSGAWGFRPRVIVEGVGKMGSVSSTLGLHLRTREADFIDLKVQHELELSLAGRLRLGAADFSLLGEANMRVGLVDPGLAEPPLAALGGVSWRGLPGFEAILAAGAGLTEGYGTPALRVIFGLRVAAEPPPRDDDGDGLYGSADACPRTAGPRANHGCPDEDRDGDGIVDRLDRCATQAGDAAHAGCPRAATPGQKDRDRDMVVDVQDHCPDVAGSPDNLGCPDADADGDGLIDRNDTCPGQAGPRENLGCPDGDGDHDGVVDRLDHCPEVFGKGADGCAPPDQDGDGLTDDVDQCPAEPETYNGKDDDDGCPDAGAVLVEVTPEAIVIKQQVFFDTGKAKIQKRSFLLLATVAKTLTLHPEIGKVRVEGHTDSSGKPDKNKALSQARADAVVKHLVDVNGIDASRLEAVGYGQEKPLNDNSTAKLRAANRRVEFRIVVRGGVSTEPGGAAAPSMPPPEAPAPAATAPAPATPAAQPPARIR
jgi:outer membrane protein OmpA-like peptidoglycan-associated protein